jgi:diguanylate cyclase (GGDEF)-like protein/PAS domain S-box-containing protein
MSLAAALIYWIIVAIWLAVLSTVGIAYWKNPRTFGTTRLLLLVVAIDTIRNVIENLYFGSYFGAQYGFLPSALVEILGKPGLLIIPKLINVFAATGVLCLLLLRWLPMASRERTKAESDVREKSDALAQEMEEHRRLFEASADLIIVTDHQRRITRISHSSECILGYSPEEVVGQSGRDFVCPSDVETLRQELLLCSEGKAIRNFECAFIHKRGHFVTLALTGVWSEQAQRYFLIGRDMTEQKIAERKLNHLAHYDQLTGLPNRVSLFKDLNELTDVPLQPVSIAIFDLDGFKDVNDTLGHSTGDQLLTQVAVRMCALTPAPGQVYRLGGDEFVVVLQGCSDPLEFSAIVQSILGSLETRFDAGSHRAYIGASAGITIAPADGLTPEELIANADLALYEAKGSGGHKSRFYTSTMRAKAQMRHEMEGEIRRALAQGEFVLHYQPQLNLRDGAVIGAEALLRWQHPERGLLGPAAFIDIIAQSSMASEIGNWVLQTACKTAASWCKAGLPPVRLAVNLFPAQFHEEALALQIGTALRDSGLPPEMLEIEITENVALSNDPHIIDSLRSLREKGVGLALDDFGTGYASLSSLRRYPLTRLKIDRSFVSTIGADSSTVETAVASSIIAMAHNLGFSVTAEGVETNAQAAFLVGKRCDEVQGFLYAKPLPSNEFEMFLAAKQNAAPDILLAG